LLDIALHALIAFLAFVAALFVEHYRVQILSRILFWKRRDDLMGTYATTWIVEQPLAPTDANGKSGPNGPVEDLVRIQWASGSYVSGTASNARYGDYAINGRTEGNAITLSYCSAEKKLSGYLGVVMLRIEGDGVLSGNWIQNHPNQAVVQVGSTTWKKR
jgi:predicted membrane metal-binding protein